MLRCYLAIHIIHKSHDVPVLCPAGHQFVPEMCTCVHISGTKWCIVVHIGTKLSAGQVLSALPCQLDIQVH